MKKILSFFFITGMTMISANELNAQKEQPTGPVTTRVVSADIATNADTISVELLAIGSCLTSIDAEAKLLTGTISGKIYLWGRSGAKYNLLDSSATMTASKPWMTFLFDKTKFTYYKDYKLEYRTSGTQTSQLIVSTVRRPDEQ